MKQKMKRTIAGILAGICLAFSSVSVFGKYTFSVICEKQEKTYWCWVATARGIARGEKVVQKTQSDAVIAVKGKNVNQPGNVKELEAAAEYFAPGVNFTIRYKPFTFNEIVKTIEAGHMVGVNWGYYYGTVRNGGHSVFIVGYNSNDGQQLVVYCETLLGEIIHENYDKFVSRSETNYNVKYEQTIYASYK